MRTMKVNDEYWMRRALTLARRGEGLTRPNPPVGAVLVARGKKISEGFHRFAGGPHAEIIALLAAGKRARGATLYVTLEPCSTWGRTPPCTDAIREAGVTRVVVGAADPNPKHAGEGLTLLREKGVAVEVGVCRAEAEKLIAPFAKLQRTGLPFVTLKLAQTLDGRIADVQGASRWITAPPARKYVHALRRRMDAIMVGGATIRCDNPSLLPRPSAGRCPLRVVVTARGDLPARCRVLTDDHAGCTIIATSAAGARRLAGVKTAAKILVLPAHGGKVELGALLKKLGSLHVLCEGGGRLAGALLRAGLVDELQIFVAPHLLGSQAVPAVAGGWQLHDMPRLDVLGMKQIGPDLLMRAKVSQSKRRKSR